MSAKPPPSDLPIYPFPSASELETFLEREHSTASGFYLKLAKKSSGIPSVSAAEAVEVALCFGWIDGRANSFDKDWWLVRYTPRRTKSIWSQKNVQTVGRLIDEGKMRPAGLAVVEAAKKDGRWARAYSGPATMKVPDDLTAALAENSAARSFFEGLNRTDRYAVLWRVETASPKARASRIESLVQMLAEGNKPGELAKPAQKRKARADVDEDSDSSRNVKSVSNDKPREPRRAGLRSRK
ncbi:hypothetical protein P170DRAFT_438286 [Aspergillus steynii IBT 23096]|uniref:Uncharacterized protein n=1 Tax=Aspergillus steynii IBT 23096 TaxID=1392250 RepID=A0A2I2G0Y4_9EURO|nr:uncharacterized protein P170DRAFT_438286 [Aspergillus steynii IBT 23096]PLB46528.1 hypothetical protein P170DRAFT_438286 [Aspergillus steynii IBT 23096]